MFCLHGTDGSVSATPETVNVSTLLRAMRDEAPMEEDEVNVVVPGVDVETLQRVVEFCDLATSAATWSLPQRFSKVMFEDSVPADWHPWLHSLFPAQGVTPLGYQVLTAANFLHIQLILDLCTAKLATALMCLTPAEIELYMNNQ